jgi:hypothetical protein
MGNPLCADMVYIFFLIRKSSNARTVKPKRVTEVSDSVKGKAERGRCDVNYASVSVIQISSFLKQLDSG